MPEGTIDHILAPIEALSDVFRLKSLISRSYWPKLSKVLNLGSVLGYDAIEIYPDGTIYENIEFNEESGFIHFWTKEEIDKRKDNGSPEGLMAFFYRTKKRFFSGFPSQVTVHPFTELQSHPNHEAGIEDYSKVVLSIDLEKQVKAQTATKTTIIFGIDPYEALLSSLTRHGLFFKDQRSYGDFLETKRKELGVEKLPRQEQKRLYRMAGI